MTTVRLDAIRTLRHTYNPNVILIRMANIKCKSGAILQKNVANYSPSPNKEH